MNGFELPQNQYDELNLAAHRLKRNFDRYQEYLRNPLTIGSSYNDVEEEKEMENGQQTQSEGEEQPKLEYYDSEDHIMEKDQSYDSEESTVSEDYEVEPCIDNQKELNMKYFIENEDHFDQERL